MQEIKQMLLVRNSELGVEIAKLLEQIKTSRDESLAGKLQALMARADETDKLWQKVVAMEKVVPVPHDKCTCGNKKKLGEPMCEQCRAHGGFAVGY